MNDGMEKKIGRNKSMDGEEKGCSENDNRGKGILIQEREVKKEK